MNPFHKPAGTYKPTPPPIPVHQMTPQQRFGLMLSPPMTAERKATNWEAICTGRDLLQEIADLKKDAALPMEKELRALIAHQVARVIENPTHYYTTPKGDH